MTTQNTKKIETIEDIIFSNDFNLIFDIEAEIKEIEAAGWTLENCLDFGAQMSKQLK